MSSSEDIPGGGSSSSRISPPAPLRRRVIGLDGTCPRARSTRFLRAQSSESRDVGLRGGPDEGTSGRGLICNEPCVRRSVALCARGSSSSDAQYSGGCDISVTYMCVFRFNPSAPPRVSVALGARHRRDRLLSEIDFSRLRGLRATYSHSLRYTRLITPVLRLLLLFLFFCFFSFLLFPPARTTKTALFLCPRKSYGGPAAVSSARRILEFGVCSFARDSSSSA